MFAAALIAAALAAEPAASEDALAQFIADARSRLLAGQSVQPDYRDRLRAMEPGERMRALIWLRRSGLLRDQPWTIDELTRPAMTTRKDLTHERHRAGR